MKKLLITVYENGTPQAAVEFDVETFEPMSVMPVVKGDEVREYYTIGSALDGSDGQIHYGAGISFVHAVTALLAQGFLPEMQIREQPEMHEMKYALK